MKLNTLLAGVAFAMAATAAAHAGTINFDEFAATNDGTALTNAYAGMGVIFSANNAGTWIGLTGGDPGNWGVTGTNGPQFLGFNGTNGYGEDVTFTNAFGKASLDFSRTNGSVDGSITLDAYSLGNLVDTVTGNLGAINTWKTLTVTGVNIDELIWTGSGTAYHPYGVDNLVWGAGAPEPATWAMMLIGVGAIGGTLRLARRRSAVAA